MPKYLYSDFLRSDEQYGQAERYWQALFDRVIQSEGVQREWQSPWLRTQFADGTAFGDGNPMFSAWSPSRSLGVRVIQNGIRSKAASEDPSDFDSWLDSFDAEEGPIRELVISCVLSEETAERAAALIRSWVSQQSRTKAGTGPAKTG